MTDDVTPLLGQVPPEILVYSTDYPHPEGGKDPFRTFDEQLAGASTEVREQFFGGSIAALVDW